MIKKAIFIAIFIFIGIIVVLEIGYQSSLYHSNSIKESIHKKAYIKQYVYKKRDSIFDSLIQSSCIFTEYACTKIGILGRYSIDKSYTTFLLFYDNIKTGYERKWYILLNDNYELLEVSNSNYLFQNINKTVLIDDTITLKIMRREHGETKDKVISKAILINKELLN